MKQYDSYPALTIDPAKKYTATITTNKGVITLALDAASAEFLRVTFRGAFVGGAEALVYAAASALRPDVAGPGYWVLAPAQTDGATVIVNRGFVPEGHKDPASRPGTVDDPMELIGVLRWPEERGPFAPADQAEQNLWFVRDPARIAAARARIAPQTCGTAGP